jgi:hypothetical protein
MPVLGPANQLYSGRWYYSFSCIVPPSSPAKNAGKGRIIQQGGEGGGVQRLYKLTLFGIVFQICGWEAQRTMSPLLMQWPAGNRSSTFRWLTSDQSPIPQNRTTPCTRR